MAATKCPKCQYVRQPTDTTPDYECPACGVVYAKVLAALAPSPGRPAGRPGRKLRRWQILALVIALTGTALGSKLWWEARERERLAEVARQERERRADQTLAAEREALLKTFRQATVLAVVAFEPAAPQTPDAANVACSKAADNILATRGALMVAYPEPVSGGPWMVKYLLNMETLLRSYGRFVVDKSVVDAADATQSEWLALAERVKQDPGNVRAAKLMSELLNDIKVAADRAIQARTDYFGAANFLVASALDGTRPSWIPGDALLPIDLLRRRSADVHIVLKDASGNPL